MKQKPQTHHQKPTTKHTKPIIKIPDAMIIPKTLQMLEGEAQGHMSWSDNSVQRASFSIFILNTNTIIFAPQFKS